MNCPYRGCTFQGSEAEVEDHIDYMVSVGDDEHTAENR